MIITEEDRMNCSVHLSEDGRSVAILDQTQLPNRQVWLELHTLEDIRAAAQSFVDGGVRHVVVSLSKDGALYVGEEGCFYAPEIPVKVRSTVGAGDALVGGLLYGLVTQGNMREGFRAGVAAGTSSVMTEGTQLIIPDDFKRLLSQVQIQEL